MGDNSSFVSRLVDAIMYAVVLVALLFGASAITSGQTNATVQAIRDNTRVNAVAADTNARLQAVNTCILQYFTPEERAKHTPDCFSKQALPFPFDYDDYVTSRLHSGP